MSCGFCSECTTEGDYDCLFDVLPMNKDLCGQWHAYAASCTSENCPVCECDCDHCCYGVYAECEDHPGVVKSLWYPVDGRLQLISKDRLSITKNELVYVDLLFQLAQSPSKNLVRMMTLVSEFPVFEYLSDDSGLTITDVINTHAASVACAQSIREDLFVVDSRT
jgi:hypothetical protein